MKNIFYVYEYVRNDGSPYYIGKGCGRRAFVKHNRGMPNDISKIRFVKTNLLESEALELEKLLISKYGRKDLGTGILINMTDGGEGISNPSPQTREKMAKAKRNESKETKEKRSLAAKNRKREPLSNETKQKISIANKGKKRSTDQKKNISVSKIGKNGPKHTEETKQKLRKEKSKIQCPHCETIGGLPQMKRWHFDQCKHKKENFNDQNKLSQQ